MNPDPTTPDLAESWQQQRERIEELEKLDSYWRSKYEEEYEIVNRIWKALGVSTYEQAQGKAIDEIVAAQREEIERKDARIVEYEELLASCILEMTNMRTAATFAGHYFTNEDESHYQWLKGRISKLLGYATAPPSGTAGMGEEKQMNEERYGIWLKKEQRYYWDTYGFRGGAEMEAKRGWPERSYEIHRVDVVRVLPDAPLAHDAERGMDD